MLNDDSLRNKQNWKVETWLTHLDEQKRGLAKLLAKENLTVRHENIPTAMFDMGSRTLFLPMWRNITVDQYDLLIGHEVGHALYSDQESWVEVLEQKKRGIRHYVNVLEDVRIEARMKREYPGLVGCFRRGYEDFYAHGPLFQLVKPTADYKFIDRINIHYKVGHCVDVPFTDDERLILKKLEACQTMTEIIALAQQLWQDQKDENEEQQQKQQQKQQKNDKQQSSGSDDSEESDDEESDDSSDDSGESSEGDDEENDENSDAQSDDSSDDSDDKDNNDSSESSNDSDTDSDDDSADDADDETDSSSTGESDDDSDDETESDTDSTSSDSSNEDVDTDPTSETDAENMEAMKKLADMSKREFPAQVMLQPLSDKLVKEVVVANSEVLTRCSEYFNSTQFARERAQNYLQTFTKMWGTTINHMAREFDRRKTAKQQERARVSRTGRIDVTKLASYKFRDDLFKTVTVVPNGKNHGIVVLIDGSTSMVNVMGKVMEQVLLFAMFARKVNIPMQAYVFQNKHYGYSDQYPQHVPENTIAPTNCQLVCVCDTMSKNWKLQQLALAGYAEQFSPRNKVEVVKVQMPCVKLHNTPLDSGLLIVERMVARMKQSMKLDKMSLIVLTDGDDNEYLFISKSVTDQHTMKKRVDFSKCTPFVARDSMTRKLYMNAQEVGAGTQRSYSEVPRMRHYMLVDSIQRRHACRVVRIHIATREQIYGADRKYNQNTASAKFFHSTILPDAKERDVQKFMDEALKNHKEGMFEIQQESGVCYDSCIAILDTSLDLKQDRFEGQDVEGWSQNRIMETFKQSSVTAARNRIFVNTVVPYLI